MDDERADPGFEDIAMRPKGANGVGRFSVEIEIANNDDLALVRRGLLPAGQVRSETIQGVVDSGATRLVLPEDAVKRLGLPLGNPVNVRHADGRRARRCAVKGVFLKLLGRDGIFHGHQRTQARNRADRRHRARRSRSARGLRGPAGRSARSAWRNL